MKIIALTLIITLTTTPFSVQAAKIDEKLISFNNFYSDVKEEYGKYGFEITVDDENKHVDRFFTEDFIKEQREL